MNWTDTPQRPAPKEFYQPTWSSKSVKRRTNICHPFCSLPAQSPRKYCPIQYPCKSETNFEQEQTRMLKCCGNFEKWKKYYVYYCISNKSNLMQFESLNHCENLTWLWRYTDMTHKRHGLARPNFKALWYEQGCDNRACPGIWLPRNTFVVCIQIMIKQYPTIHIYDYIHIKHTSSTPKQSPT